MANGKVLAIVVGIDEPARSVVGGGAANLPGCGVINVHAFDLDHYLAALALAAVLLVRNRRSWLTSVRRKPLLTANEAEFFHRLQRALPGFRIFPQV